MLRTAATAHLPFICLITAPDSNRSLRYLDPIESALFAEGVLVHCADWNGTQLRWSEFDAALLCFRWQRGTCTPAFRAWGARIGRLTALIDPVRCARWESSRLTVTTDVHTPAMTSPYRFLLAHEIEILVSALLSRCSLLGEDASSEAELNPPFASELPLATPLKRRALPR